MIRLLTKELLSLRLATRENPGDVESSAKLAGLEEAIMIAPDVRSSDDIKVAVVNMPTPPLEKRGHQASQTICR